MSSRPAVPSLWEGAMAAKTRPHCLDAALHYADVWGMAVFPANPVTKIPLKAARFSKSGVRWGATRDLDEIEDDFRRLSCLVPAFDGMD